MLKSLLTLEIWLKKLDLSDRKKRDFKFKNLKIMIMIILSFKILYKNGISQINKDWDWIKKLIKYLKILTLQKYLDNLKKVTNLQLKAVNYCKT